LRHGFITAALDAGVPLRDVQEAASHADPRTTMRYDRARVSLDRTPPTSCPRSSPVPHAEPSLRRPHIPGIRCGVAAPPCDEDHSRSYIASSWAAIRWRRSAMGTVLWWPHERR
jgi:hypothetical protein